MCHRCGESGSFYKLQTNLGDKPEPIVQELAHRWDVWMHAVEVFQDAIIEQPEIISYLKNERGLTAETIGKYRLGWAPRSFMDTMLERWKVADLKQAGLVSDENRPLFWDRIMIPYYQRGHVVTMRGKQIGGNVLQAKDTNIHLFGADNLRGHSEVYICEGEFDAMYLSQLGYPACAVPGAMNYQEKWNAWFEEARRVFVVLDADETGRRGAHKISAHLGRKARIVEFPVPGNEKTTDVSEYFLRDGHVKDDFDNLCNRVRGQRIFTFGDSLKERDELQRKQGMNLGWKDLDLAIHPGLLPGQIVTVLAKTGAGKTAFITQVAHNLSRWQGSGAAGPGIPTLVLSLEQTRAEIGTRLERIGKLYNPFADSEEMSNWYSNLRIVDENKIPPKDVPLLIEEFIDDTGHTPRLMVVDYLGYWSRSFTGKSKYEQVSEAVMELKSIAKEYEMAILAPHQVSRSARRGERLEMDFARDSGVVEETSDFVFGLVRPNVEEVDDTDLGWIQRADLRLELLKSRHGNVGRQIMMLWAPYSLASVPRGGELEWRVQKEWEMYDLQAMYTDVLAAHQHRPQKGMFT
jgi:KaiC/GvpD/RAD55 family RecA-like ATPase